MYNEITTAKTGDTCEIRPVSDGPSMHDILEKTRALAEDIRCDARLISNNLFGHVDEPPQNEKNGINCAQDLMLKILDELVIARSTLNYIVGRL